MKKLFVGALVAAAFYGYGQSYFNVSVGYGLGVPGLTGSEADWDANDQGTIKVKNINMGGGINATVAYGLPLLENMHLDLALGYQNNLGSKVESSQYIGFPATKFVSTSTIKTSSFQFAPSLRFSAGEGSIRPFVKVGPQLLFASMKTESELRLGGSSELTEEKYSMNVSIGATAAVGAQFAINDNMMFIASLFANLGFYSPSSSEYVIYELDGEDMLDQLDVAEKKFEYEKELTAKEWNEYDPDEPTKDLKQRYDYSSIGLAIGILILL